MQDHPAQEPIGTSRRQSTMLPPPILLICFWFLWTPLPGMAASATDQMAKGAADVLELGKKVLGLEATTPEGSERTGIANGVPFLVRFRDTVGGLEPGAAVLVRGMRMGTVREVKVTFDPATSSFDIPVIIELDPAPFAKDELTEKVAGRVYDVIEAMVRHGLRAKLVSENSLLGSLAVALEMQPEAAPAELGQGEGGLRKIPTADSNFEALVPQIEHVIARISALPLERVVAELENLITAARRVVDNPAVPHLLANAASASDALVSAARQLDPTLRSAKALAGQAHVSLAEVQMLLHQSDALPEQIDRLLEEFTSAARSMRLLAEMLERRPEAIVRGKGG